MSLSKNAERWPLRSKDGKEPSEDERKTIEKLPRDLLFPCSTDLRELEMPKKRVAPREMNSFIIFRRQLALIAKQLQLSDDGKLLSRFASYIWHGASQIERQGYADIAEELKQRHYARYPDYTYERRKRKTNDNDFIVNTPATIIKTNGKRRVANNNNNSNNHHNKNNNNSNNNNNNNPSPIPPVSVESNNLPIQQDVYVPVIYAQAQDPVFSFTTGINDDMFQAVQNVDNSYNNLMHQYPYILTEFYVPNPTMEGPDCCEINGDNLLNNYMHNFDDTLSQPTLYQTLNEGDTNAGFTTNINEDFLPLQIPVDEYYSSLGTSTS